MAESLRRLNQAHETNMSRTEPTVFEQLAAAAEEDHRSEIYHSLEDAVPISEDLATPATPASLQIPPRPFDGVNAPVAGQVCR